MHIFPKFSSGLYLFYLTETLVAYMKWTRCFPFTEGAPDRALAGLLAASC